MAHIDPNLKDAVTSMPKDHSNFFEQQVSFLENAIANSLLELNKLDDSPSLLKSAETIYLGDYADGFLDYHINEQFTKHNIKIAGVCSIDSVIQLPNKDDHDKDCDIDAEDMAIQRVGSFVNVLIGIEHILNDNFTRILDSIENANADEISHYISTLKIFKSSILQIAPSSEDIVNDVFKNFNDKNYTESNKSIATELDGFKNKLLNTADNLLNKFEKALTPTDANVKNFNIVTTIKQ